MIDAILNSRRFQNIIAIMKMKAAQGIPAFQSDTPRIVAKRHRRPHWRLPHQGVNEMARRRRQIERGQLTASNGLCIHKGRRIVNVPFDALNQSVWFNRVAA